MQQYVVKYMLLPKGVHLTCMVPKWPDSSHDNDNDFVGGDFGDGNFDSHYSDTTVCSC